MNRTPSFGLDGGEARSARQVMFAATCWLLAVVTGVGAAMLAVAGVMSSDSCRPDDTAFICTGVGQSIAWWLPLAGYAGSVVAAWASVVLLKRRARPRWPGLVVGMAVYSAAASVEWLLVSG